jgi:hypothetical protein
VHDQRRAVDLAEAPGDVVAIHQAAERGGDLLAVGRGPFGVLVVPLPRAQDVDQTTSWTGPGPCSRNPNRAAPQLMTKLPPGRVNARQLPAAVGEQVNRAPGWRGSTMAGRVGRHVRAGREVRRDRLTAGRTRSRFVTQDGLGRCRRRQGLAAPPAGRKPPATIGWRGRAERLRGDQSFATECFDNRRAWSSTAGHAPHCVRPPAR